PVDVPVDEPLLSVVVVEPPPVDDEPLLSVEPPPVDDEPLLSVEPPPVDDEPSLLSVVCPLAYIIAEVGKTIEITIKSNNKLVILFNYYRCRNIYIKPLIHWEPKVENTNQNRE